MSHGKMPLESHFQEACTFLAAVLISARDLPEHWYVPMLLCSQLIILPASANLLNLVMEASGFVVKHGKNRMRRDVMHDAIIINGYVDCLPCKATFCRMHGRKDRHVWV
jgi:hypothetical protein